MYCGKCGTQNPEGARFCKECGAPMDGSAAAPSIPVRVTLPALNQRTLGLAAVAIIAVIVIAVCVNLFGGNTPEAVASEFMESMFIEVDSRRMIALVPEELLWKSMEMNDLVDEQTLEDFCDQLDEQLVSSYESMGVYTITYEILEVSEATGARLLQVVQDYEELDLEVSDMCIVEAEVTITAEDMDDSRSLSIPVVKIDGDWYLDISNLGSLLG